MNLAIFQPDIPQNTGAIIRICSCFNINIDIIHPTSFALTSKSMNRVAMDYINKVKINQYDSWEIYKSSIKSRIILLSTHGKKTHTNFKFKLFLIGIVFLITSEVSIRYAGLNNKYNLIFIITPIILFLLTRTIFNNRLRFEK